MLKRSTTFFLLLSPLLIGAVLSTVLMVTDPVLIGPGGVLGVFFLIYLEFLSLLFVVLFFGIAWLGRLKVVRTSSFLNVIQGRVGREKAYYIASIIAFAPVVLLAMHTFSSIQWTDVMLITMLVLLAVFFVIKRQ